MICNTLHISRLPKESFGFQCAGVCIGTTDRHVLLLPQYMGANHFCHRPVAALAPFAFARTGLPIVNVVGGSAAEAAGAVHGFSDWQLPRNVSF